MHSLHFGTQFLRVLNLGEGFAWRRAFRAWVRAESASRRRNFHPPRPPEPTPPANAILRWANTARNSVTIDALRQVWQDGAAMKESENQLSFTRAASSTMGSAQKQITHPWDTYEKSTKHGTTRSDWGDAGVRPEQHGRGVCRLDSGCAFGGPTHDPAIH